MIKKTALIFLLLISTKIFSQKCKTDKDPFTNEKITSFNLYNKTVYFEIKNDSIRFDIIFKYWGERNHEFPKGTKILVKLENDSKIELETIKKSKPKIENITFSSNGPFFPGFGGGFNTTSSEKFTAYSFKFLLDKTKLKSLTESKIDIIRVPDTDKGEYVDLKAKGKTKKKIKAIKKGATCISENL